MLTQQVDALQRELLQDLHKGQEKIYDALVAHAPTARLPEPIFANYFLPGFLGTNPNPNWMMEWISIAGSPAAPVTIFEPGTGAALFVVPPVLSTRSVMLGHGEGSIADILQRHEMMKGGLGPNASRFLFNALQSKSEQAFRGQDEQVRAQWLVILQRYGRAPTAMSAPPAAAEELFEF